MIQINSSMSLWLQKSNDTSIQTQSWDIETVAHPQVSCLSTRQHIYGNTQQPSSSLHTERQHRDFFVWSQTRILLQAGTWGSITSQVVNFLKNKFSSAIFLRNNASNMNTICQQYKTALFIISRSNSVRDDNFRMVATAIISSPHCFVPDFVSMI